MEVRKAEIITIGNEVLAGYTINTNAAYISRRLLDIGLPVNWVCTIRDEHDEIITALKSASQRADAVIVTGGLGPTPDDLTKKAIADFFQVPMYSDSEILKDVERFLQAHNRPITDLNRKQAYLPQCDNIIRNPVGTAPGLVFYRYNTLFYFTPGVPREMKHMVDHYIIQDIQKKLAIPPVITHLLRTTGVPESTLYEQLQDVIKRYPQVDISFLPRHIGVDIRFRQILLPDQQDQVSPLTREVKQRIDQYIFSEEEKEMEQVLGELLKDERITVSVAESFTGGLLQDLITNVPGSSAYFLGGMVTYSNQAKTDFLAVSPKTLQQWGAVSKQTAMEMARGVQKKFNTHCAIATTGIAGPTGATATKPVGLCYIAVRYQDQEKVKEFHFGNDRVINKRRGAMAGMAMLRQLILQHKGHLRREV